MNSEFSLLRKSSNANNEKYSLITTTSSTTAPSNPNKIKHTSQRTVDVCESFEMSAFGHSIKLSDITPKSTVEQSLENQNMVVNKNIDNPPTSNTITTTTNENMKPLNENVSESLFVGDQNNDDINIKSNIDNDHQLPEDNLNENLVKELDVIRIGSPNKISENDQSLENENNEAVNQNSSDEKDSSYDITVNSDCMKVPFPLLPGECYHASETILEGTLFLTNYRFYIEAPSSSNAELQCYQQAQDEQLVNLPIGVIDSVEVRDILTLLIFTKYVQSIILTFNTSETAAIWQKRFSEVNQLKIGSLFCFKFFEHFRNNAEYSNVALFNREEQERLCDGKQFVINEFERMRFDSKSWRICELNKDFKFSNSYPKYFIVPNDTTDKELDCVANFRYSRRVPAVVWRSQRNGCIIARSSQPVVGWLGWRSSQDERLLQRILHICSKDVNHYAKVRRRKNKLRDVQVFDTSNISGSSNLDNEPKDYISNGNGHIHSNGNVTSDGSRLLILDARSYAAALANRAMGGGCEYPEYYINCEVQFMGLANIHTVRKSFYSLRYICEATQIDQPNWFTLLDNTKWFHNLSALLKCALVIVDSITILERPVLVHCSDGWDRTPQIVSLAELMLDPFYRTIDGFKALIQREWLDFGHKFADRCRSSTLNVDLNERCPVFLQWLDCVHQLLRQFPAEFEFNEQLLIKLVHHTYSGLFGTFTCNCVEDRFLEFVYDKTVSFWAYVESEKERMINYLYLPKQEVLRASSRVKDLLFWNEIYVPVQSAGPNNIPYNDIAPPSIGPQSIDDDCDDADNEGRTNPFVTRSAEFVAADGVKNTLNEANIDESKIDQSKVDLNCPAPVANGLSQSKSDLTRAASFDSLNKVKFDSPSIQTKKSSPTVSAEFEPECRLRVKHLSDTCLYDSNEISNDRDHFLSPSDFTEERPISEKISDDSSCDDNASTKYERRSLEERFCDGSASVNGAISPKPNPDELFDIDGEFLVKDKSVTQVQKMIIYHKRMINSLSQQLQNGRSSHSRTVDV